MLIQLLDLTMDAFDDVRNTASHLILYFDNCFVQDKIHKQNLITRAEDLMRYTGRADYSDGFARLTALSYECSIRKDKMGDLVYKNLPYSVLKRIEEHIVIAKKDLSLAVSNSVVLGNLIALRYIQSFYLNIIEADLFKDIL
jgi:hypothetical protein